MPQCMDQPHHRLSAANSTVELWTKAWQAQASFSNCKCHCSLQERSKIYSCVLQCAPKPGSCLHETLHLRHIHVPGIHSSGDACVLQAYFAT